jgi:hypothetical protein
MNLVLRHSSRTLFAATVLALVPAGSSRAQTIATPDSVRVTEAGTSTLTISWVTDVPATGGVEYGLTRDLGSEVAETSAASTQHTLTLTGLRSSTSYFLRAYATVPGDRAYTPTISSHTALVVLRPSAASNGVRSDACNAVEGLQPSTPGPFPGLLFADSAVFGAGIQVTLIDPSGRVLPVPSSGIHVIDSTLVSVALPIGSEPEGLYDLTYTQSDRNNVPVTQRLVGALRVFRPFCFTPQFEQRKVSLLWGQYETGETPGTMSPSFTEAVEALPGFNGYKIWRGTSRDTSTMQLLRRINLYQYDQTNRQTVLDSISWSWKGQERAFADPDSFFFRRIRQKVYTSILNGVPQESEWVWVRVAEIERFRASPHTGVHYYYAVTAEDTSGIDITLKADNMSDIVPQSSPSVNLSRVQVVPNPYYGRSGLSSDGVRRIERTFWDRTEDEHKVQFTRLPARATVRIYTSSGDLVAEIDKTRTDIDALDWDVRAASGEIVSPGVYLYRVVDAASGEIARGHFVILP